MKDKIYKLAILEPVTILKLTMPMIVWSQIKKQQEHPSD